MKGGFFHIYDPKAGGTATHLLSEEIIYKLNLRSWEKKVSWVFGVDLMLLKHV